MILVRDWYLNERKFDTKQFFYGITLLNLKKISSFSKINKFNFDLANTCDVDYLPTLFTFLTDFKKHLDQIYTGPRDHYTATKEPFELD